jgi:HEAT repeat protein
MTITKDHIPRKLNEHSDAPNRNGDIATELYKALRAFLFYPEKHPLRNDILQRAYQFLVKLLNGGDLLLAVTRNGFSSTAGGIAVANSSIAKAMAKELFLREIQRLSFLPGLSFQDFQDFLELLTIDPQKIVELGGMEKILAERGIRSIITNVIDVSAVFTKRQAQDAETGERSREIMAVEESRAELDFLSPDETADMEIDEIIASMEKETDDDLYLQLAKLLLTKAQALKERNLFEWLVPVVLSLIEQGLDSMKSQAQRNCALAAFEQIAAEEMTRYLLLQLENRGFKEKETVYLILGHLGEKAAPAAIQRICAAGNIHARKALATALVRIGKPAVPSLLAMLNDARWYVVRGMLTILGEIRCKECVQTLRTTIYHDDDRVRKEAIRSLTKIGGPEAAEILIELLHDKDPSIVRQVIFSLGILKSDKALGPLLDIIKKRDIFLKSLPLKKEAVQAIGLIGDKGAIPYLEKMAKKGHWLAAKRGEELKIFVIGVIGRLGDESSLFFLQKMSAGGGPVGRACNAACVSIKKKTGNYT